MALILPRRQLLLPAGTRKPAQPVLDPTHPLSRGLVGAWLLGDGQGGVAQDLTKRSDGSPTSITLASSHSGGESYAFNGSTSAISLPANPEWNFGANDPISISAWVNLTFGGGGTIIDHISGSNRNFSFSMGNTDFDFLYGSSGYNEFRSSGSPALYNGWNHLGSTFTYNANNIQLYLNGQPVSGTWVLGGGTSTPDSITTAGNIGGSDALNNAFHGSLEGIRLWKRYLTPEDMAQLYAQPYAGIIDDRPRIWFFPSTGTTTINGTIAVTEANDTFAASVTHRYDSSIAVTEANDSFAANVTHYYDSSIAVTEQNDQFAASVTHMYVGTIAVTEANDNLAASGSLQHNATIAVTEQNDSFAASITHAYLGTISVTEANDNLSASGSLQHNATIAVTETSDSFSASVTHKYVGTITVTEANDSFVAHGSVPRTFHITVTESRDVLLGAIHESPVTNRFGFADIRTQDFLDWGVVPYESYFKTFQFAPDTSVKSQTPYLYTFLKQSDTSDEDSEGAFVRVHWDWANDNVTKRSGPLEQVYKFHNGGLVGTTRQKLRGRGRTAQLEFRNDGQKNFNILGWTLYMQTNQGE